MATKKTTKKDLFSILNDVLNEAERAKIELPEVTNYEELHQFVNAQIDLLDKKTAAAQKRAAEKRASGDELREKIFNTLSTSEYMTVADIVGEVNDPDVSAAMVVSRLSQLVKLDRVEKDKITLESASGDGKSKKLTGYRAITE